MVTPFSIKCVALRPSNLYYCCLVLCLLCGCHAFVMPPNVAPPFRVVLIGNRRTTSTTTTTATFPKTTTTTTTATPLTQQRSQGGTTTTALWAIEKKPFKKDSDSRSSSSWDKKQNNGEDIATPRTISIRKSKFKDGHYFRHLPKEAVRLYVDYAGRLWNETNPEARKKIANHKAAAAIRQVQHIIRSDDYRRFADFDDKARGQLLDACSELLRGMELMGDANETIASSSWIGVDQENISSAAAAAAAATVENKNGFQVAAATTNGQAGTTTAVVATPLEEPANDGINGSDDVTTTGVALVHENATLVIQQEGLENNSVDDMNKALASTTMARDEESSSLPTTGPPKKNRRSILFGAAMGLAVACWVFSGNYIFTGLFTLMTILGQLEYYRMVQNTGVYPARRISVVGASSMFLTALFFPDYHQICLPIFGLWAMIWFLTVKRTPTTIPEIATTFTGMFYLGYVPSFWVRIRLIGANQEPTRLAPLAEPFLRFVQNKAEANLPSFIPQAVHLPITTGAVFIFWTWLCLAFSDVGAYFVGKNFGKTKLAKIAPAAGAASPNKTVEGVLGACAVSAVLAMFGAWVQKWPLWPLTGAIHGAMLALLGLLGDLTASMLKRDAGLKDFGDLIPEHGGVMDRVDSFIWSAPYSWLVCTTVIPALKQFLR